MLIPQNTRFHSPFHLMRPHQPPTSPTQCKSFLISISEPSPHVSRIRTLLSNPHHQPLRPPPPLISDITICHSPSLPGIPHRLYDTTIAAADAVSPSEPQSPDFNSSPSPTLAPFTSSDPEGPSLDHKPSSSSNITCRQGIPILGDFKRSHDFCSRMDFESDEPQEEYYWDF